MAGTITTLRCMLTQKKNLVICRSRDKYNTQSQFWPKLDDRITFWDDFTLVNLNESYGHILDQKDQLAFLKPGPEIAALVVNFDEDIVPMISWSNKLVQLALQIANSYTRLQPSAALRFTHSEKGPANEAPDKKKKRIVENLIQSGDFSRRDLVVGLGRNTTKFSDRILKKDLSTLKGNDVQPLRQLANACKNAKTRYGYIQTDRDLIACCFSQSADAEWKVAIQPVSWSSSDAHMLTADLALWWLCMLAMSPNNDCDVVEEGQMVRINHWDVVDIPGKGQVRRHRYSHVEKPLDP